MIRSWIRYLAFLLPAAFLYFFFGGYLFFMIFVLLVLLPLFSFAGMRLFLGDVSLCFEQRKQRLYLTCKDQRFFPLISIRVRLLMENRFSGERKERLFWFFRGQNDCFPVEEADMQIGLCVLQIGDCICYDLLGLFHARLSCPTKKSFLLYPSFTASPLPLQKDLETAQGEALSAQRSGFMEDKHEVREYRPGDSLHRIHHKLSCKLSKTMIREFAAEEEASLTLFLELSGSIKECSFVLSAMKEAAASLNAEGRSVLVCWNSASRFMSARICDEKSFWQCMDTILSAPKAQHACSLAVFDRYRNAWLIDASGMRRPGKEGIPYE